MVVLGVEAGGNARALGLIHATRVLMIVTVTPFLVVSVFGLSLDNPVGQMATETPPMEILLMLAAAIGGWKIGERIGLFGAALIGPLIVTAALSLLDLIHVRPPAEAIWAAQFFIGIGIGVNYVGITAAEIRRYVLMGGIYAALLIACADAFASLTVYLGITEPVNGYLAFAPGGQAEMAVLSIAVGADIGFIIAHHLVRLICVITGVPIVMRWMRLPPAKPREGPPG